jgi:hypothetical protein
MILAPTSRLYMLTGLLALFAFGGDIVVDAVADACGNHCVCENSSDPESQHEKAPCSHCSCAGHNGSVVATATDVNVIGASALLLFMTIGDESTAAGVPPPIDHPPQLA